MTDPAHLWRPLLVALAMAALLGSSFACGAAELPERKKPKPRNNAAAKQAREAKEARKEAQADVAAAQAALQGAKAQGSLAEGKLNMAQAKITVALQIIQRMKEEIDAAEANLRQIEADLEARQPPDSDYARAKAWAASATQAYLAERAKVFASPAYKGALARAKASDDPAEAMARVQREALEQAPNFSKIQAERDAAEGRYALLRQELFTTDETWKSASGALRMIRGQIAEAESMIASGGLHKASAIGSYRQAQDAVEAANAALARSQAELKAVQAKLAKSRASRDRSPGAKKK